MSLFAELKRRNVFRVAIAYVLIAWVLLQAADFGLDLIDAPNWVIQALFLLAALGLPVVLTFSWVYEMTPAGLRLEKEVERKESIAPSTGRKLDRIIIAFLAVTVVFLIAGQYYGLEPVAEPETEPVTGEATQVESERDTDRRSVAVLPFDFRSNNPDDEFFAEGIHDDLLTQLAKIGSLKVISRTSVMEYKDTTKKIPQIATELGVATIVEGGVQRSGSRIRINAQLIDAVTDEHLWAESFDRKLTAENLFDIQAEISRAIASALQATLSPAEQAQLDRSLTGHLGAWESYRRAIDFRQEQSNPAIISGLAEINHALTLDPNFAAAYGLKATLLLQRFWFFDRDPALRDQAWEAIEIGRGIDPDLAELDLAEGYYYYWGFLDYDPALIALDRAIKAQPNNARIHEARSYVLRRTGRWADALDSFRRTIELNPRQGGIAAEIGATLSDLKRYDEAEVFFDRALTLLPSASVVVSQVAVHLFNAYGDLPEARRHFRLAPNTVGDSAIRYWEIVLEDRDFESAARMVDDWAENMLEVRVYHVSRPILRGLVHAFAGRREEARELLAAEATRYEQLLAAEPDQYTLMQSLCQMHGALDNAAKTMEFCGIAKDHLPNDEFIKGNNYFYLSIGLAMAGADGQALDLMAASLAHDVGRTVYSFEFHPAFDGLRENPQFKALIEQYRPVVPQ